MAQSLRIGSLVVTHAEGHGFAIGTVVGFAEDGYGMDTDSDIRYKWIVDVVNLDRWRQLCEDQSAMERRIAVLAREKKVTEQLTACIKELGFDSASSLVEAVTP